MRDTARHLTEGPQPFLLHYRVLRLPQIVVGLLQRPVELRLMDRKRNVLAQVLEKFAVGTAESLGLPASGDEHAEDVVLHDKRCDHQRAQLAFGESLRERKLNLAHVGLIDELPTHAAREPVRIDRHGRLLCESKLGGGRMARRAHGVDGERLGGGVVETHATEVNR